METHDFLSLYQSKADEEILLIARDRDALVLEARAALDSELSRRGIYVNKNETLGSKTVEAKNSVLRVWTELPGLSTAELLLATSRTYWRYLWVFVRLMAPAVVLSYYVVLFGNNQARLVGQHLMEEMTEGGPPGIRASTIVAMALIRLTAYYLSWTASCAAFGAVSSAVAQACQGEHPSLKTCLADLRAGAWPLLGTSTLLYFLTLMAIAVCNLVSIPLWQLFPGRQSAVAYWIVIAISWMLLTFGIGRLALSVPAVIVDGCGVRESMFRSDELTSGRWRILAILITKFVVSGFVVGLIAFRLPGLYWQEISNFALRMMTVFFLAGLTVVEPLMFIGFSLLYLSAANYGQNSSLYSAAARGH